MLTANSFLGFTGIGNAAYTANAVDYDGATNYLFRSSTLTGIANGSTGIFYCFFRLDGRDGQDRRVFQSDANERVRIRFNPSNQLEFAFGNAGGTSNFVFRTVNTYTASSTWYSVLASWNTNLSVGNKIGQIYINDASDSIVQSDTFGAFTIPYATEAPAWYAGADATPGGNIYSGCMAELYFGANQFLDFSNVSNRRRFITAANKPVNIGASGSSATGTQPNVYFRTSAGSYGTNGGSGGNFTQSGTFNNCSTSPSS